MNWWIILCLILLITLIAEHVSHVKQVNQAKEDEDSYYKDIVKRRDEIYELQDKVHEFKAEYNQSQKELDEAYEKIDSLNEEIELLQEKVKNPPVDFAVNRVINPVMGYVQHEHIGFSYPRIFDERDAYSLECKMESGILKALKDSLLSSLSRIEIYPDPTDIGYRVVCEIPIVKTNPADSKINLEEKYPIVNAIEKIKGGNM